MPLATFKDWDQVQDNIAAVPSGRYLVVVESFEQEMSTTGKLMYTVQQRIQAPAAYKGMVLFERFVVGSAEDPEANDPQTWLSPRNVAVKRMKALFKGAALNTSQSITAMSRAILQKKVVAVVSIEVEPALDKKTGDANKWAGQQRNRVDGYYKPGEADLVAGPALTGVAPPTPVATSAAAPAAAPAKVAKPRAEPKLECAVCDQLVPRSQYEAHEQAHIAAGEVEADTAATDDE